MKTIYSPQVPHLEMGGHEGYSPPIKVSPCGPEALAWGGEYAIEGPSCEDVYVGPSRQLGPPGP